MQLETSLSKTYLFADGQKGAKLERALLIINEHLEPNQRSNQVSAKVSANCTLLLSF